MYVIAYVNLISKTGLHVDSGISSLLQCVAFIHLFEYLQGNIPVFVTTSELENISQMLVNRNSKNIINNILICVRLITWIIHDLSTTLL